MDLATAGALQGCAVPAGVLGALSWRQRRLVAGPRRCRAGCTALLRSSPAPVVLLDARLHTTFASPAVDDVGSGWSSLPCLPVVVDGVTTPGRLALLRDMGHRLLQGYAFSRPLEAGRLRGTGRRDDVERPLAVAT